MLNTELSHIISPMSAPWSGWTLLVLFLCAVLGEFMQPGIITQATTSLWAKTDRTYKSAPTNTVGQLLISLFRFGTLGMAICMSLYTGASFSFVAFAAVCGLVFAVLIIKMLCNRLLDYTFMLSRRFMPIYEQYANIATIASCILYPGLLVLLRIGRPEYSIWVLHHHDPVPGHDHLPPCAHLYPIACGIRLCRALCGYTGNTALGGTLLYLC